MKKLTILFLLLCFTISCKKETVKTPGQVSADQINAALSGTNIKLASINVKDGTYYTTSFSDVPFQLSGQFIIVTVSSSYKYYYNLDRLVKFEIST